MTSFILHVFLLLLLKAIDVLKVIEPSSLIKIIESLLKKRKVIKLMSFKNLFFACKSVIFKLQQRLI